MHEIHAHSPTSESIYHSVNRWVHPFISLEINKAPTDLPTTDILSGES